MDVLVRTLDGRTVELHASGSDTIDSLKAKIQGGQQGIPGDQLQLTFVQQKPASDTKVPPARAEQEPLLKAAPKHGGVRSGQKTAIVTGASSGIGKDTVLRLLKEGYEVHAGARRLEAMRELEGHGAHLHYLDLTQPESIEGFMESVLAASGRVDVLVNNAGYGAYGAVEDVPLSDARAQMEVNLFGLARLTQLALPAMRAQRAGRIINVSSIGGRVWSPLGAWYQASKFALEGFSDCLRNELRPFGIEVVVVQPGGIKTEWASIIVDSMMRTSGSGPYREIAELAAGVHKKLGPRAADPSVISDAIWTAISVKRPAARYVAPFSGKVILWLRWALSDSAFDWLFGKLFNLPKQISEPAKVKAA